MRKVVSHSEVSHLWANQLQDEARSQGNFFFTRETIYSYGSHFPIAKHVEVNGEKFVLFTLRSYSNTTAKHIQYVRQAASHLKKVYCYYLDGDHERNVKIWFADIDTQLNKLKSARKPEIYIAQINRLKEELNTYLSYFKFKLNNVQKSILTLTTTDDFKSFTSKAKEREDKERKRIMKVGLPIVKTLREEWRNYLKVDPDKYTAKEKADANAVKNLLQDSGIVYLRTNGEEVETSKGVQIPTAVARRAYEFYKRIVSNGGCDGNCNYQILNYQVNKATPKNLVVGCHDISIEEIEYIAAKLNW